MSKVMCNFAHIKLLQLKKMKKAVLLSLTCALAVSCQNNDTLNEKYVLVDEGKENAENMLGFTIASNQTWDMEAQVSVKAQNIPTGFNSELTIYSANPLADTTATIITTTDDVNAMLSFTSPNYLTTLYAGCADKDGNLRVVPFEVKSGVADYSVLTEENTTRAASRRAGEENLPKQSELDWQPSANATDLAEQGWNDQVAIISGAYEPSGLAEDVRKSTYAEYTSVYGDNDVDKLLHTNQSIRAYYYATVGKGGGEVAVTPIGSNGTNNAEMYFGYFYFEKGEAHNVKTVKKYLFNEIYNGTTKFQNGTNKYQLVYYDADGTPSYTFPEGTEIGFFCRCVNVNSFSPSLEWYAEGEANIDRSQFMIAKGMSLGDGKHHDWWQEANHVIMFQRNGKKLIGFEDWISNFNMKDIVLQLKGNVEDFPEMSKPSRTPNHHIYTFAFEDTKNGDYDLNDVVLQVYRGKGWTGGNGLHVKLVALGAMDPLKAYFYDKVTKETIALFGGKELHELFGQSQDAYAFVNTESINYTNVKGNKNLNDFVYRKTNANSLIWESLCAQDFYIVNEKTGQVIHTPRSHNLLGAAPYGLCIPHAWAWPKEKTNITKAYPKFVDFGSAVENNQLDATDWYVKSVEKNTLIYDFGFNVE